MRRVTRREAASILGITESSVDRRVKAGRLASEVETDNGVRRVVILLDADAEQAAYTPAEQNDYVVAERSNTVAYTTAERDAYTPERDTYTPTEVAELRSENRELRAENHALRELADYHRKALDDAEWRYRELLERLKASQDTTDALTRMLPPSAPPRRRWWPFGRNQE